MENFKFLILLINLIIINYSLSENSLRNLFIIHRHGNRNPVFSYPNDLFANISLHSPDGIGQLTSEGKRRMYNVGKFLRNRYGDFLGDSIRNVYVRSLGLERCLESVQLVVNGAFKSKSKWNMNQNWIPIPIHTMPIDIDSMLYAGNCPAIEKETDKIEKLHYAHSIHKKYENLFKYLTLNSGNIIDTIKKAGTLYDTITAEQTLSNTFPAWATADVLKQMKKFRDTSFILNGFTRRMQRLKSGLFLDELTKKIRNSINKSSKDINDVKRINIYSSNDNFISVLLSALQINNALEPSFGATLLIELHQHNESENSWDESNSIKIFYLNETETNKPYQMVIPDCQNKICTIKQFISSISDLILSHQEWVEECNKLFSN